METFNLVFGTSYPVDAADPSPTARRLRIDSEDSVDSMSVDDTAADLSLDGSITEQSGLVAATENVSLD